MWAPPFSFHRLHIVIVKAIFRIKFFEIFFPKYYEKQFQRLCQQRIVKMAQHSKRPFVVIQYIGSLSSSWMDDCVVKEQPDKAKQHL